ncbi:MAG: hypothetical protein ACRYFX_12575 [Janthinobacterium lividum]
MARCAPVANGIVEAYEKIGDIRVPVIVRLQGTNTDESSLKVSRPCCLKTPPT